MKIVRAKELHFIPASHEDPKNPGVLKKVLVRRDDLDDGRLQMINWAKLDVGKSFQSHFHEDMDEVFIILSGKAKIWIEKEDNMLETGDAVIIPEKQTHRMENIGTVPVEYIAMGITRETGGKTVVTATKT